MLLFNKSVFGLSVIFLILLVRDCKSGYATPFDWVEKMVNEYEEGIEHLAHVSQNYDAKEGDFDFEKHKEHGAIKDEIDYDFIVIGAGTAGSVVANRLTEIPEWKVLLLEAGHAETPITLIPAYGSLLQTSPYNWGYVAIPQKTACLGMENHQCALQNGKAIGGSSAINGMIYTRGNHRDYDLWADDDNKEWCFNDVLPYFKKAEDDYLHHFDRKFHHQGGPLHISSPDHASILAKHIFAAGKELDIETVDYNGKEQLGFGLPQQNIKYGKRHSVGQAYIEPAKERHNLFIKPLSQVVQILTKTHTKEAYGVKYLHDGKLFVAKANKEVILSAGAINTPQLLMLSGIGPKEHLEKLGIECVQDLHVGHGLRDHVGFNGLNFVYNHTIPVEHDQREAIISYLKHGEGPLSSNGVEAIGYVKTKYSKEQSEYPDIELIFTNSLPNKGWKSMRNLRVTEETYDSIWKPLEGKQGFSIMVMHAHPKSVGTVILKDKDPLHFPIVDLNLLSDEDDHDIDSMVAGIQKVLKIVHTESLQKLGFHLNHHPVHGCKKHEFASDLYWKCAVRHISFSLRHYTGTAKMGPQTDKFAVVDNNLRVHGIGKLRVVDNSVIPVSITGHTMAVAVVIGEKASDLIKHDWIKSPSV